jgi:hypothetical protein
MSFGASLLAAAGNAAGRHFPGRESGRQNDALAMITYQQRDS